MIHRYLGFSDDEMRKLLLEEATKMYKPLSTIATTTNSSQWNYAVMDNQIGYFMGTQNKLSYLLSPQVTENDRKLIELRDTRNFQFLNKLGMTAVSLLTDKEWDPQVNRIDFASRQWRKELKRKLEFTIIAKSAQLAIDKLAQDSGLTPEEIPDKPQFIDAIINGNGALEHEAQMLKALLFAQDHQNIDGTLGEAAMYLLANGCGGVFVDTMLPHMEIDKINPRFTWTSFSSKDDCTDISAYAEIKPRSLSWLKQNWMGPIDPEEWQQVESMAKSYEAIRAMGLRPNQSTGRGVATIENDKFVLTERFRFKRTYRVDFRFKHDKFSVDIRKKGQSLYDPERMEFCYGGNYIPGTQILFNYGVVFPQTRPTTPVNPVDKGISNPMFCGMGVIMHRPMQSEGVNVTWVDRIMPIADTAQRIKDQYDNLVDNIKPGITAIDYGLMIDLNKNDVIQEIDSVRRILLRYRKHGEIYFDSGKLENLRGGANRMPITTFPDTTVQQLETMLGQLREQMLLMREMGGIPPEADGIVQERTGNQVLNTAMTNVAMGLRPYEKALQSIHQRLMKELCIIYQYDGIAGSLGQHDFEINEAEYREFIFNITTKPRADKLTWAKLQEYAGIAFNNGDGWLSYADLIYITDNPNIKDAQNHFLYLDAIHRKEAKVAQNQAIEQNSMLNKETAENATAGKVAEIQAKGDEKLKEIQANLTLKHENDMDKLRTELASQAQLESTEIRKMFAEIQLILAQTQTTLNPPKETVADKK